MDLGCKARTPQQETEMGKKADVAKLIMQGGRHAIRAGHTSPPTEPILVDAADTAALLRATLAEEFPGHKNFVRTSRYSMGSSVEVWVPGVPIHRVRAILSQFGGADFDGTIDGSFSHDAFLLPDGRVRYGGTRGSGAAYQPVEVAKPVGAVRVQFLPFINGHEGAPYA
jgi:hypothetical protein